MIYLGDTRDDVPERKELPELFCVTYLNSGKFITGDKYGNLSKLIIRRFKG